MLITLVLLTRYPDVVGASPLTPPSAPKLLELTPVPESINELIEGTKYFDQKVVTIAGEAIGDVMEQGEFGWVNINDGSNAIGVWAPVEMLKQIRMVGRYQVKGDWIKVTGTFYRADPQHGGDIDIRATSLLVERSGRLEKRPVPVGRAIAAGALLMLASFLGLGWWYRRRWLA